MCAPVLSLLRSRWGAFPAPLKPPSPLPGPKAAPHLCFIPMDSFAKVKEKKVFFSGKAGVPAIMTIADHNKCTTNLPSKEIKDYGKEERGTNFLNHTDHAKQSPHFAASDPQARRGK